MLTNAMQYLSYSMLTCCNIRVVQNYSSGSSRAAERCCGRASTYPGLENRGLALSALPDRRGAILEGVIVFILRRAVVEVKGVCSCGG